ncbi:hypothetical protein L6R50_08585 [Myxococcota bacterium]|nr:hypothetical protein [Myxococcota bacterium]
MMPAAADAPAISDGTPRPFGGNDPDDGALTWPVAAAVGACPSCDLTAPDAANGAVGVGMGPNSGQAACTVRGTRPRVPTVGLRLTATGPPSFRAWASCLTLGDLEDVLRKAVA